MTSLAFSVIIPTSRRNDALAECLALLAPGRQQAVEHAALVSTPRETPCYEVIVTDDGGATSAETLIKTRFPWAHWTPGPALGPAANRNHGTAMAKGNWLAFLDDDCLPGERWLQAYREAIEALPDAAVMEGRTSPPRGRERLLETAPINEDGGCLWACNFAIRREFFESLGGFNPQFPHASMEDCDLHQRIKRRVIRVPFVRDALVVHPWRPIDGERAFLVQRQSELIYASLHPEVAYLRRLRHWVYFYLRAAVKETPGDWRRYPGEMLRVQPLYLRLQLLHLWALATKQGPEFYRRRLARLDQKRQRAGLRR